MKHFVSQARRAAPLGLVALLVFALFVGSLFGVRPMGQPVQAAVITPVLVNARGPEGARVAEYFVSRVITSDTRVCFDLAGYEAMDLQYQVDATAANTTTVSLQQTNIDPTAGPFNAANAIATVVSTDANAFSQVGLFGRWNCVLADVTNSNPITFTIVGVAK
jgi:hypothetical protein